MNINEILSKMGFRIVHKTPKNNSGPDLVAVKGRRAFSFEIKKARRLKSNSIQCPPVEPNRTKDDFIIIEMPSGYILIEPMEDHLKLCSVKGFRTFGGIR